MIILLILWLVIGYFCAAYIFVSTNGDVNMKTSLIFSLVMVAGIMSFIITIILVFSNQLK